MACLSRTPAAWGVFLFVSCGWLSAAAAAGEKKFAMAIGPTPVFNNHRFPGALGNHTHLHPRARLYHGLLFTAFPGTAFEVAGTRKSGKLILVRVKTNEYNCKTCWVDSRHLKFSSKPFPTRRTVMPKKSVILKFFDDAVKAGVPYCWGCNFVTGVPRMIQDFQLTQKQLKRYPWDFKGLDCSGLLYGATGGATPRDTSRLLDYGVPVPIAGRTAEQIIASLRPLDIIVWQGHMVIVEPDGTVVETVNRLRRKFIRKTIRTPVEERLGEIMARRRPVNNYWDKRHLSGLRFVVRRWHPEELKQ